MTTDPLELDNAQLYAVISAAIEAGVPAPAAVQAIEVILSENENEPATEIEQGTEE